MLNILIVYHKRKLNRYIRKNKNYNQILKQSQLLDKYINKKMFIINKLFFKIYSNIKIIFKSFKSH